MDEFPAQAWDEVAGTDAPPFVRFDWLDALERTGCVGEESGWIPAHLALWDGATLVAACPTYLKTNSEGEFVFDYAWADFARRIRISYYPKLVCAVPFTPATGPRALVRAGLDRRAAVGAFAETLRSIVAEQEFSSAHVLFPPQDECADWEAAGFLPRNGVQYHWANRGYRTFDDFLGTFNAKRRHQIRRERREVERQGLRIETLRDGALDRASIDTMFGFYTSTIGKFGPWGRQYLTREFFHEIARRMPRAVEVVFARDADGRPVGGAFNVAGSDILYGRYWGCSEEHPFLHFAVCYYHGVDEAIARGLTRFEPGAGGEHKRVRGFNPVETFSAHYLRDERMDRVIRDFLVRERTAIAEFVRGEEEEE
jgi:predicted N-acyltransferase